MAGRCKTWFYLFRRRLSKLGTFDFWFIVALLVVLFLVTLSLSLLGDLVENFENLLNKC